MSRSAAPCSPTGYADTLGLIRDGERGLEAASPRRRAPTPWSSTGSSRRSRNPGKIFGSGVNYASHGDEEPGFVFPDEVVWDFIKLSSAIVGPGDAIVIPPIDDVIVRRPGGAATVLASTGSRSTTRSSSESCSARRAKNVRREDALDHVFGYTVFNDVGARSIQFHNGQRDLGKNFDTFCPMGPCIVTRDELPDWEAIRIQSHVNGELRQDALVGEQLGPPPVAIEWLSSVITLEPGDCLMTGTPAGCGTFMDPPRFLQPGDVVTVSASGIGELDEPGRAGHGSHPVSRFPRIA